MGKHLRLPGVVRRLSTGLLILWVTFAAIAGISASPAAAAPKSTLSWTVRIDGQDVTRFNSDRPLNLKPGDSAVIFVRIENHAVGRPISVRSVRLESRVLGLAFFSYETRVDLSAKPGRSDTRQYSIDLLGLGQQATGLLPARVLLLDAGDNPVASRTLVVRVHGSLGSVYGTFGLAVAAITVVLLAAALWSLFRGRQHPNRWRRGLTFAAPGFGVGFILTFTLSAAGVLVPSASKWTVFIVAGGAIGFLAGYLTPNPYTAEYDGGPETGLTTPDGAEAPEGALIADEPTVTLSQVVGAREPESTPAVSVTTD